MIHDERCVQVGCTKDDDCTAGLAGRCAAVLHPPLQAGEIELLGMFCVYEEDQGQEACVDAKSLDPPGYYYCP